MTRPPNFPSELRFAALLQYSPDGTSEASLTSREQVLRIKRGSPVHIARIALRVEEAATREPFGSMFGKDVTLVPVPRSRPFKDARALWPAMRIAALLLQRGLARDVLSLLERREPIEKSALQRVGAKRPGPEDHFRTIDAIGKLPLDATRIVLVDDIVTRGATCSVVPQCCWTACQRHAFTRSQPCAP